MDQRNEPHVDLILALSEDEYNLWRHSPITAAFLKFLKDSASHLTDMITANLLEQGEVDMRLLSEARGRIWALTELTELPLGDMQRFYWNPSEGSHEPDRAHGEVST